MKSALQAPLVLWILLHGVAGWAGDLKLSLVQYAVEGNQTPTTLLDKIKSATLKAKKAGSTVVLFPELAQFDLWPVGKKVPEERVINDIAETTPGLVKEISALAKSTGMVILAGTFLRRTPKGLRNTALIAKPDGSTLFQDKLHLTPWELQNGWVPGDTLQLFELEGVRAVLLICFDVEAPQISAALGKASPELFLVPSMTESKAGLDRVRWTAQARAVEHAAFVAVTATVGTPSPDFPNIGRAFATGPRLEKMAVFFKEGPLNKQGLTHLTIPVETLRQARLQKNVFHPAKLAVPFRVQGP